MIRSARTTTSYDQTKNYKCLLRATVGSSLPHFLGWAYAIILEGEDNLLLKKLTKKQKMILLVGLAVLLLGGVAYAFLRPDKKSETAVYPEQPSSEQSTNGDATDQSKTSTTGGASSTGQSGSTSGSSTTINPPQGQASHTVISKSADAQAENSPNIEVTCITTAGNNCVVRLTSPSGQVTTINNSYDDKKGNFIFNWNASSYALGSWKMELVASRDGKEASSNIGPLEIKPWRIDWSLVFC